jgi:hypothetical protein
MKEECEKSNYLLKKLEIDLNEKNDILEREKENLINNLDDALKKNSRLTDDLLLANRTISDNAIELEKLTEDVIIQYDHINTLRQQLEESIA